LITHKHHYRKNKTFSPLLTGVKLVLVDAGIKIGYGLFAVAFDGCFVISPIGKTCDWIKTLMMINSLIFFARDGQSRKWKEKRKTINNDVSDQNKIVVVYFAASISVSKRPK